MGIVGQASWAASRTLRVGHIDLGFHDAAAREVEEILGAHGHPIVPAALAALAALPLGNRRVSALDDQLRQASVAAAA